MIAITPSVVIVTLIISICVTTASQMQLMAYDSIWNDYEGLHCHKGNVSPTLIIINTGIHLYLAPVMCYIVQPIANC